MEKGDIVRKGIVLIKPFAFPRRDEIVEDIEESEFDLSVDQRIAQRWTKEKIEGTYRPMKYNKKWPMVNKLADIYFDFFGKEPMVEALMVSSDKNTIKKLKKLVGPLDAAYAKRPEDSKTLRKKYGCPIRIEEIVDEKKCYFFPNGIHVSSKEEFPRQRNLYLPRTR
ncbi:MAG: hypothetical protein JW700_01250 [Candidatus Aenigmarchaeota archaeon]|nr:hypothetical protein [Candidatus Aenigmarchaeota archaeon]